MIITETIQKTREIIADARSARTNAIVGFVPTMGALHEGHLSLVEAARRDCQFVVVSIFVNPTQFGRNEDFGSYPKPIAKDLKKCKAAKVDLLFNPSIEEMYGRECLTNVHVRSLTKGLCGRHRPGHFDGVATVVTKLFNIVQPDRAYFGQKDAQQAVVIQRMVEDLNMPIEIVACPLVREPDGLAMSSRNAYLNGAQREQAAVLYHSLLAIRDALQKGRTDLKKILREARRLIEEAGPCEIDYVELVDPQTMQPIENIEGPVLAALAVRIGPCRLIDNLLIDVGAEKG